MARVSGTVIKTQKKGICVDWLVGSVAGEFQLVSPGSCATDISSACGYSGATITSLDAR